MRMFFVRLWKWLLSFTIQSADDNGDVVATINILDKGISLSQFKPMNPGAQLLTIAISQEFIEQWTRVSLFNQIEVATWDQRARDLKNMGIDLPYLMALREMEQSRVTGKDNRDVS